MVEKIRFFLFSDPEDLTNMNLLNAVNQAGIVKLRGINLLMQQK
jgi:hypothetical protein